MTFARDVVALDEALRKAETPIDRFGKNARSALAADPAAAALVSRMLSRVVADPATMVLLALQALELQHFELRPKLIDAAFVMTVPGELPTGAQPTAAVVREMLASARSEVVALGYELTHGEVIQDIADAIRRGVAVTLICDRERLKKDRLGAAITRAANVYVDAVIQRQDAPYGKMHCKCLLVDGEDLLITSANFTFHGLHGNIEFGVRLRGAPCVEARRFFEHLVRSGFLRRLTADELTQ